MERKHTVNICGYQFSILSDSGKDTVDRTVAAINEKVKAITDVNDRVSTTVAALIVCMDLYDELEENKLSTGNLRMQLKAYFDDASKASEEIDALKHEVAVLKMRLGE